MELNQTAPLARGAMAAKTDKQRVATRDLVTIGQVWRRRARRAQDRVLIRIVQVHRGDREVEAQVLGEHAELVKKERIRFAYLRAHYELQDDKEAKVG